MVWLPSAFSDSACITAVSEHLLCASHFTHVISCYPHDTPVKQGFSPPLSPARKLKHMCPWSPGK